MTMGSHFNMKMKDDRKLPIQLRVVQQRSNDRFGIMSPLVCETV